MAEKPNNPQTTSIRAPFVLSSPPPTSFSRVTRDSSKPVYESTSLVSPIPEELIPEMEYAPGHSMIDRTDISFDRNALRESTPLPEVVPVLLGLRSQVAEWRADRLHSKLEGLVEEQKVMRYIGERVLRGKGYLKINDSNRPDDIARPHRLLEKGPGTRLNRINKRRQNVARAASVRASSYPDIVGKRQTFKPFFDQYDRGTDGKIRYSWGERRSMGKAARKYRNNDRTARLLYDNMFRHVVTKPSRDARGLAEKRDKLVLKATALEKAKEERQAKRKSGEPAPEEHISALEAQLADKVTRLEDLNETADRLRDEVEALRPTTPEQPDDHDNS